MVFDAFFNEPQWVVGLVVKVTAHCGQDFECYVGHIVSWVDTAKDFHRAVVNSRLRQAAVSGLPPTEAESLRYY